MFERTPLVLVWECFVVFHLEAEAIQLPVVENHKVTMVFSNYGCSYYTEYDHSPKAFARHG